jgi:hypothetical protein
MGDEIKESMIKRVQIPIFAGVILCVIVGV